MNLKPHFPRIVVFVIIVILIILLIPISNPHINYNGTYNNFELIGNKSEIHIKADYSEVYSETIVFRNVKNIEINNNGEIIPINDSSVQVDIENENERVTLSDTLIKIRLNNYTMVWENVGYPLVDLEGDINDFHKIITTNSELITINNYHSLLISINGTKIPNSSTVSFKMDNTSYIDLCSDLIKIRTKKISELQIFRTPFSEITLQGDEGNLLVNNRAYYINSDNIYFKMNSKYSSSISVTNSEVYFKGCVNSGKINNENIIYGTLFYWFDQETEKISVLIALILASATVLSFMSSNKNIKQTEQIIKQTKAERMFDNNEKLLMFVYSPMEVILTKFNLSLDHIFQTKKSHEIPDEYDQLFKKMNADLLEIKRNYGYLLDNEVLQLHYIVCDLWKQYLNSEESKKKMIYLSLNSSIIALYNSITNKISEAKQKREEINQSFDS